VHRTAVGPWHAVAVVAAGLAAGCGSPPGAITPTAPPSAGSSAAPAENASTTAGETPATIACGTAPVEGTIAGASGLARITEVVAAGHEDAGYDRLVIRLSAAPTSYRVVPQVTAGFTEDASGRPVILEGTAGVRVSLQGVAGTPAYAGPTDPHAGLAQLREARQTGSFEGVAGWGLGLARAGCIRVLVPTAAAPTQLVVDIASR
jgi:hypothetical protein